MNRRSSLATAYKQQKTSERISAAKSGQKYASSSQLDKESIASSSGEDSDYSLDDTYNNNEEASDEESLQSGSNGESLSVISELDSVNTLKTKDDFINYGNKLQEFVYQLNGVPFHDSVWFKHKSAYNFDFKKMINGLIETYQQFKKPVDGSYPIDPRRPHTSCSKAVLAYKIQQFVDSESLSLQTANNLAFLFTEILDVENFNLPMKSQYIASNNTLYSQLLRYCMPRTQSFSFSQCPQDNCMVFVGDYSNEKICNSCKAYRFTPCKRTVCKERDTRKESLCFHNDRISIKNIHYRSIIFIIRTLLDTDDNYVNYLNYKFLHPQARTPNGNSVRQDEYRYHDIQDGETARENLSQMNTRFKQFKEEMRKKHPNINFIEVSLLLSYFYDGVQLFKRKVVNFWLLLIQILNLPPTMRSQKGLGMFCLGIFSGLNGSKADEFLLGECFIQELHILYDGYVLVLGEKVYFLQARVIVHQFDTKAFEKVVKVQASNSLIGCPICHTCCGRTHAGWGKGTYLVGTRLNLPTNHKLRVFGSGFKYCGVNEGDIDIVPLSSPETKLQNKQFTDTDISQWQEPTGDDARQPKFPCEQVFDPASLNRILLYNIRVTGRQFDGLWYHSEDAGFARNAFHFHLFYPNSEGRPMIPHVRKSTRSYNENYLKSEEKYKTAKESRDDAIRRPVQGVHGMWFAKSLPYVRFEDTNWCSMHVLKNIYHSIIDSLTGVKMQSRSATFQKYCKMKYMHPSMWKTRKEDEKFLHPWQLDQNCQNTADAYVNSIKLPKGYGNSLQAKDIFKKPSCTNCHAAKMLLLAVLPYLMDRTRLEGAYKIFIHMLAEDLVDLFRPYHTSDSIERVHERLLETVAIHEGMYPPFYCNFIWHQVLDLPKMIKQLGCLEGWSGFWGERYVGVIKKMCPQGGINYDYTIMERVQRDELSSLDSFTKENSSLREQVFDPGYMGTYGPDYKHYFTNHKLYMYKPILTCDINLEEFERNILIVKCLLYEILVNCNFSKEEVCRKSALGRLYEAYEFHFPNFQITFVGFLLKLHNGDYLVAKVSRRNAPQRDLSDYLKTNFEANDSWSYLTSQRGFILESDKDVCIPEVLSNNLLSKPYRYCRVSGERFYSRGFNCREMHESEKRKNAENNLQLTWNRENNISCWCKWWTMDVDERKHLKYVSYGQLNSFHKINFESEPLLHDAILASVCTRIHTFDEDHYTDLINKYARVDTDDQSLDLRNCRRYIFCKHIVPTAIAVVGIVPEQNGWMQWGWKASEQNGWKPWDNLELARRHSDLADVTCYAEGPNSNVKFLHLIDIHPTNTNIKYDSSMKKYYYNVK